MKELVIYSKPACPYCHLLKRVLDENEIDYRVVDLSDDAERQEFYVISGKKTVPQLYFIDSDVTQSSQIGLSLGGWSDVKDKIPDIVKLLN